MEILDKDYHYRLYYYIGRVSRRTLNDIAEVLQSAGVDATCSLNEDKRFYQRHHALTNPIISDVPTARHKHPPASRAHIQILPPHHNTDRNVVGMRKTSTEFRHTVYLLPFFRGGRTVFQNLQYSGHPSLLSNRSYKSLPSVRDANDV